jgi:hypothetical protein
LPFFSGWRSEHPSSVAHNITVVKTLILDSLPNSDERALFPHSLV